VKLRSSSMREPRDPLSKVVFSFSPLEKGVMSQTLKKKAKKRKNKATIQKWSGLHEEQSEDGSPASLLRCHCPKVSRTAAPQLSARRASIVLHVDRITKTNKCHRKTRKAEKQILVVHQIL
ncbi:hypothetical protein CIL05_21560, partial [Virgibacillus profundi]